MEEVEIWKSLDFMGFDGYDVSNMGNVKSLNYNHTGKERLLKPCKDNNGYMVVSLCKDSKRKKFTLHRLVALAFLENPQNLPMINHKDENRLNNRVENLEWVTPKENMNYGTRNEKISKAISKPIIQLDLQNNFIREWDSMTSINLELNINQGNITNCCKGRYKTCGGFIWKYKE